MGNEVAALNTPTQVAVGSEFLGYRIDELIGRGGMGVVYRAYDLRLKRPVALKLVTPELELDEGAKARFARETELVMALEHPNVVPIHDAGDVDGRLFFAMRLVEGTDLRALLREERALDPARALAISRQVASALDAAHARGLVHRDVKPSNVLLDGDEHVYLADFGLTRRLRDEGVQPGEDRSLGTPAYIAPEQIEGGPLDGRTDVYSLGCLLHECLTGQAPFGRASRLALAWAHLEEEPPRATEVNAELPGGIDDVIRKAMAKEPDDRYPTCAALVSAADAALGFRKPSPLSRRRLLLACAVLVALTAALAALLTRGGTAESRRALFAGANTLARIDPATNAVNAVIHVGRSPAAAAFGGHSVWVYNHADRSLSEIDARTNAVRHVTPLSATPRDLSVFAGPILAADPTGAWIVGVRNDATPLLTNVLPGARGERVYRLDLEPRAVALGYRAVWVVGRRHGRDNDVERRDPRTGRVVARISFPTSSPLDSVAIGYGAVWVVGSSTGTLYRIDPRVNQETGDLVVGKRAARPASIFGSVWVGLADGGGKTSIVDPRAMTITGENACCPPDWGDGRVAHGSLWLYDWPSGAVLRQSSADDPPRSIRVVREAPVAGGACLTSLVFGAGAVWVTVGTPVSAGSSVPVNASTAPRRFGPSSQLSCRRGSHAASTASALAGGRAVDKQRVEITSRRGVEAFVLRFLGQGESKRDAGDILWSPVSQHFVTRNGLSVEVNDVDARLFGKRGNLDVHFRIEWLGSGNEYSVGTGTWSIVGGTRAYAALTGGGRQSATWVPSGFASFSSEGFVYPRR